ncbi:sigma-70 family RNA polymerase sigma factor [Streptomyces microflavus]|uniref:sigma-70 family RNA polymerase sigma factor n=1 Tax=Streptomyces TaxID=1883 RepID=UPI0029A1E336|nr:sigma-70 family RNA polymerase sigma factor [Streptomyces sp. NRRL_B-2249]MDX2982201.1 sigma-70 family RNA polymerase sigma factor [Streptomyces sp. NRRL_B-2249]
MTESVQNPVGFPAPKQRALRELRPAPAIPKSSLSPEEQLVEDQFVDDQISEVHRHARLYKNSISRLVPDGHSEDVYQDAVLRLTSFLRKGGQVDKLRAFMQLLCKHAAADHMRGILSRAEILTENGSVVFEQENVQVLVDLDVELKYGDIHQVLVEELTELEHRAYYLTVVQKMTSKEVGKLLGPSHDSIRHALSRATAKLREPRVLRRFDYRPRRPNHQES